MASVSSEVDIKEEPLFPFLEYYQVGFQFFIARVFITSTIAVEGAVYDQFKPLLPMEARQRRVTTPAFCII